MNQSKICTWILSLGDISKFNKYFRIIKAGTWPGVGFEVRDGVYDSPNRTLCSGIIKMIGGSKRLARGYWGDIVCSPYLTHGIFSPLKSMYEVCRPDVSTICARFKCW